MSDWPTFEEVLAASCDRVVASHGAEKLVMLDPDRYAIVRLRDGAPASLDYFHRCWPGSERAGGACGGVCPLKPVSPGGWTVDQLDPLTISPSVWCKSERDCGGDHGFIRDARWVPA